MEQVLKSVVRRLSVLAEKSSKTRHGRKTDALRALDPKDLQSVKGGDGGTPTSSPTKTW